MRNMYVDWVVAKYFSSASGTSGKVVSPAGEYLEVGNFESMIVLAEIANATSGLQLDITTALDVGQVSWIPVSGCSWTSWSTPGPDPVPWRPWGFVSDPPLAVQVRDLW